MKSCVAACLPLLVASCKVKGNEEPTCEYKGIQSIRLLFGHNPGSRRVSFCVENTNSNWIAFGPGTTMKGGIRAVVFSEEVKLYNITSQRKPDTNITFADFGLLVHHSEVSSKRKVCFSMPYAQLEPPNNITHANFAWAVGDSPKLLFHTPADANSISNFNFINGTGVQAPKDITTLMAVHMVLMMVTFLLLFPLGALLVAYARPFTREKQFAHQITMLLAITLLAAGIAVASVDTPFDSVHGFVGLALAVLCFVLYISAFFRPDPEGPRFKMYLAIHRWTGRGLVVGGYLACVWGTVILSKHATLLVAIILSFGIFAVVAHVSFLMHASSGQDKGSTSPMKHPAAVE